MPQPFEYKITEHIATIGESGGGYTTELNRVAFRDYPPKLDLRKWWNGKPQKGITLTEKEARNLYEALGHILGDEALEAAKMDVFRQDPDCPFTEEEIRAAKTIDDLFHLQRVDNDG